MSFCGFNKCVEYFLADFLAASGYGFTGEYQSADLVYLRARHYAPGTGRFLTRDTWPGQANRPLSFNRWGYVEGNPVNLTDPTGMSPYTNQCAGLSGNDRLYCEKIIRGFNPLSAMSLSMVLVSDFSADDCGALYKILDKPTMSDNTSQSWGFWFHFMENEKSRIRGGEPVGISKIIALALSAEANVPSLRDTIKKPMANAMITKGRKLGMYAAIGSRSVVRDHLKPYLFFENYDFRIKERNWPDGKGGGCGTRWGTKKYECSVFFEQILAEYAGGAAIAELNSAIQSEVQRALYEIRSVPGDINNIPWDWGNSNLHLEQHYGDFHAALRSDLDVNSPQMKTGRTEIYYRSQPQWYDQFFILSKSSKEI